MRWIVRALRKLLAHGAPMIVALLGATLFLLGLILGNSDILTSGLIVAFIGVNLYILKLLLEFIIDTSERTKLSSSESETQELLCRA